MGTEKQKRLAKEIIKNSQRKKPLNKGKLLAKVGYAKSITVKKPTEIMERKGVKDELKKLGFNKKDAKSVVAEILGKGKKDSDRLKAADMIFKVEGEYAPEKVMNFNANVDVTENKKAQALADEYEKKLKQTLCQKKDSPK